MGTSELRKLAFESYCARFSVVHVIQLAGCAGGRCSGLLNVRRVCVPKATLTIAYIPESHGQLNKLPTSQGGINVL